MELNYSNLHKKQNALRCSISNFKRFLISSITVLSIFASRSISADEPKPKPPEQGQKSDTESMDLGFNFSGIRGYDNNNDGETINVGFEQYSLRLRFPLSPWLETVTQVGLQDGHLAYRDPKLQTGVELNLKLESDLTLLASEDVAIIIARKMSRFSLEYFGRFEIIKPGAISAESITLDSPSSSLNVTNLANSGIDSARYFDYRADTGLSLRFKSSRLMARLRLAYTFFHVDLKIKYNERGRELMDDFNITDKELKEGKFEWDKHGGYIQPSVGAVLDWFVINLEGALFKINSTLIYQVGANLNYRFDN